MNFSTIFYALLFIACVTWFGLSSLAMSAGLTAHFK